MSDSSAYKVALGMAKSPDVRRLMSELLRRSQESEHLSDAFARQVLANRTKREGRPAALSRAQDRLVDQFKSDANAAAESLRALGEVSDRSLVFGMLHAERMSLELFDPAWCHSDDRASAERLVSYSRETISLIERFLEEHDFDAATQ